MNLNLEKIGKLLDKGYGCADSTIAKQLLLASSPELKEFLINKGGSKHIDKEQLKKMGIKIKFKWDAISFPKHEFPELWERQQ